MNYSTNSAALIVAALLCISCDGSRQQTKSVTKDGENRNTETFQNLESVTNKLHEEGWNLAEALGKEGAVVSIFDFESSTLGAITAHWVQQAQPQQKSITVTNNRVLLLRCEKSGGDSFVIVLVKGSSGSPKPDL